MMRVVLDDRGRAVEPDGKTAFDAGKLPELLFCLGCIESEQGGGPHSDHAVQPLEMSESGQKTVRQIREVEPDRVQMALEQAICLL